MSVAADHDLAGVAIIGMACRFPGADTPSALWRNLCEGAESVTFFTDAELLAAGVPPRLLDDPSYVKAAAVLADADKFDAGFFGFSPREAGLLDPQQRLLLEVAWEAFEDAGYHPESHDGVVGVFAGGGGVVTSYLVAHPGHPALAGQTASLPHLGNDKDFLATRVSYKLNLTGPSVTVQTACSTSLVAVHLGCQSLLAGECDMVLAGATTVRIPQIVGYLAEKGNIYSLDGHCRPFDAAGQGTIFGSGVAAVLLKKVGAAVTDGDHIYAVIKGTAVNNDGGRKVSYLAPSVTGQARAMVEAFTLAGVSADSVRYVECHATGTAVGDPQEIEALTRAFRQWTPRTGFCAVGSVKANIGHPEQTAGLASLIKAALVLQHRRIPATLHFTSPNSRIDFATSPFFVNSELRDWPGDPHPRRCGVNSLGIGGTNAFVVLEEAPPLDDQAAARPPHVLTLSAKTEAALNAYADRFAAFLASDPDGPVADLCHTTNLSRSQLPYRLALTTASRDDLRAGLARVRAGEPGVSTTNVRGREPRVAFLFSGQGSQYRNMAAGLYRDHPIFRDALDRFDAVLRGRLERPLLDVLLAEGEAGADLDETAYTQPALVAVELALAALWRAWGVAPAAVLGHSVGALAAAAVAGALDPEEALALAAERGRLMQALPKTGAMVAVFAAEDAVRTALDAVSGPVSVAAVNGRQTTVVSGDRRALQEVVAGLERRGIATRPLRVSHAFHSPLMEPILDEFEAAVRRVAARPPVLPLVSDTTGKLLEGAPDAAYWREHARRPVRFADGLQTLHGLGINIFLELGPGAALLGLGREALPSASATWLPTLPRAGSDWSAAIEALARLYLEGVPIDWHEVHRGTRRRRVALPTYPFQRRRYWLDPAPASAGDMGNPRDGAGAQAFAEPHGPTSPPPSTAHPLLGHPVAANGSTSFEAVWSVERLSYLRDHRIGGVLVLPTAVIVEAALAAGRARFGVRPLEIEGLVYHEVLRLAEGEERRVRLTLTPVGVGRANFSLTSAEGGVAAWRPHASGVVCALAADRADGAEPDRARRRCRRAIPPDRYYASLHGIGLEYGPSFRGIRELRQGRGVAVSRVCLPSGVAPDGYGLHPAFLDACLHIFPAVLAENGNAADGRSPRKGTYLPVGIERLRAYRDHPAEATVTASLRTGVPAADGPVVDIRVTDDAARVIATIEGLSLRRLHLENLGRSGALQRWLYELRWEERPPPRSRATQEAGAWLLFVGADGVGPALAAELERCGGRCYLVSAGRALAHVAPRRWTIDPGRPDHFRRLLDELSTAEPRGLRGTVFLWATDEAAPETMTVAQLERAQSRGAGGGLFLAQALTGARADGLATGRLWFVTRNAQRPRPAGAPVSVAQALLWGLGRTVELEAPALWGGLVDLPEPRSGTTAEHARTLAAEVLEPDGENQVALREGTRYVARLSRLPEESTRSGISRFRREATYLITGGLGLLGLRIARWLVESEGARSLVLVSRRRPSEAARDAVDELKARGARVRVIRADVAVEADIRRVLAACRRLPPLRGVFHCAGVLDDSIMSRMTWQQFTRVTAAKVRGSWLLHRHTRDLPLDVFGLQSSLLSLTGSAGQANYTAANAFLDALVDHRRMLGLPATAVNWGPWEEAGMARSTGARGQAMWKARGVRYLPSEAAIRALAEVLRRDAARVAVTDTDWPVFLGQLPAPSPFYGALRPEVPTAAPVGPAGDVGDVRARLSEAPAVERRGIVVECVRRHVMRELGFEEAIDTRQPLNELGLDSLMSVNVANRLEAALGVPVPVVKLIRGPTVEQLADNLIAELAHAMPSAAGAAVAASQVGPAPEIVRASRTEGNGWLVFPRPNPSASVRLFCFPFAGAGAAPYRPWVAGLHPGIELVAIEPPGRATRVNEPPVQRLDDFFATLTGALRPFLDRPAAFFGHCLGGLIAWETARRLRQERGLDLRAFVTAGVRPPHRLTREGPFEQTLLERMLRHREFDPLRPVHEQPDEVFAEVTRHFAIGATDEFLAKPELRRLLLPAVRADFALTAAYRFTPEPPWDVPITCFAGLDDPYVSREDAGAWSGYTSQAFRLYWRTGDHFLVVDDRAFIVETLNRELGV